MNVIVICEFTGEVRSAFERLGHNAWSCDLLPSERGGKHFQCDCRSLDYSSFDLLIAHPDCTHLAVSGARWWKDKQVEQAEAIAFVLWIASLPVPRIAIENPIGRLSGKYADGTPVFRKPDQIIQPWQFGHGETKATCLWLKGLPLLVPTNVVEGREARIHHMPPSPSRGLDRSRTYSGVAEAVAHQWGGLCV